MSKKDWYLLAARKYTKWGKDQENDEDTTTKEMMPPTHQTDIEKSNFDEDEIYE